MFESLRGCWKNTVISKWDWYAGVEPKYFMKLSSSINHRREILDGGNYLLTNAGVYDFMLCF